VLAIAISGLALAPQANPEVLVVHDVEAGQAVATRVAHFNRTLRQAGLPGRVRSCSRVVDLSYASNGGVHYFGAICSIRFAARTRDYAICDNQDVGSTNDDDGQAALGLSWSDDRKWLVDFTRNNCSEQAE
jgi:hypothetical protein